MRFPLAAVTAAAIVFAGCAATTPAVAPAPGGNVSTAAGPTPSGSATPSAKPAASASGSPSASAVRTSATPSPTVSATRKPRPKDTRTAAQRHRAFTVGGIPVVSKKYPINAGYRRSSVTTPHGLTRETQAALSRMIRAARADGVRILVRSGYRSYALQGQILRSKIREYGSERLARRYNAAPGRSEHQTGLSVDLWDGRVWGVGVRNTRVGKWLWANAWRYGFILRYPNGKEAVTGYAFEPWHYRFVGVKAAKGFGRNSDRTLEEYLGLA